MGSYKNCAFIFSCCILLFFFVPIKINTIQDDFDLFLSKYNKTYNSSEYERRLEIYKKSLNLINFFNSKRVDNLSAVYGVTEFTDLIPDVFLSDLFYHKILNSKEKDMVLLASKLNIPERIDWRERGVISGINNQKSCGACWAFTTIQNIETMFAINTKQLQRFSVQQMIDCSVVNSGCNGGDVCLLLGWIKVNNVAIMKEEDYPLQLVTQRCQIKNSSSGVHIKKFNCENLIDREDIILKYLATTGPVIAAVNAASWHYYVEGVIRFHCDGSLYRLNHAVQIVGYDLSDRIPYYIVRNSWGMNFGVDGYLKIAIGQNMCGIASKVVTVIL